MSSIYESIKSIWFSAAKSTSTAPTLSIYDERIKCFQKLAELQKNLQSADNEYLNVSIAEGTAHENALKRMETFTSQYKKEYELCEKIMKYQ
jgi:hypothetical protein